jgi:predicted signal transduction protein with EAL and GGDEF domain
VADRLRGIVRESDLVARFGGDEFVVLQSPVKGPEQAASLARRIVEVLAATYEIEGHQVVIGASAGIAMAPSDGKDADMLLKNADMALYRAKSDGRAGWRFFEPDMDVKAQARRSLELDLRNALATDAFQVYYQPLLNLRTMHISTCEALMRWPHPERGMVSPAEFIPIAEEMGLIVEIGNRILKMACGECAKWPSEVRVAVNLSPIQFRRGSVTSAVREALAESGLPANRLEVEITESVLLHDTEATRACLQQLRDLGVRISLDDFGTGYSSLSYLHSFPLDKVKIDRSFLHGIEASDRSLTLLRGVARLSADLGMSVVIEGVETERQLSLITRDQSINEAQGYLFSPAIPNREIRKLLYSRASLLEQVA